ncbi:tripartite tricarboxylate transporter TctB family protein [Metabacillus endolithicus]|uniref:Tripartite tricarboxylate transporter TctB family protein n=1 Tax=Metabacillus endolithicus TaxID=1535204 RepID=A0ABW5BZW1_9BACI|nr:tripartite tricarboxylate transporter TctB family protein [Metabacillus endolithicus]UPG62497.1 tripartite tricarboxylate transporter TctB family protein [Metabacillus endolithicus]
MRFWLNIAFFVFSLMFTIYGLTTLKFMAAAGRPGSGFFPVVIGSFLILTTAVNVVKDLREMKKNGKIESSGINFGKEILWTIIVTIIFVFIFKFLGGLLSMILFMLGILFIYNRGKLLQNALYSVIFPVLMYMLFEWLNAGLPKGIIDIGI